jgi:hypothetical protein
LASLTSFSRARFASLGVGRERDRLLLHGGVDDHLREVLDIDRLGLDRDREALLQQDLQPRLTHPRAPAAQRRAIERRLVAEELHAAEVLPVWVLGPAQLQLLVRQSERVLEDREAGHQPRGQWRLAGAIRVHIAELLIEQRPAHLAAEPDQLVAHVDDLVEPRPEQIVLTFRLLARPHPEPPLAWCKEANTVRDRRESDTQICKEIHGGSWKSCNSRPVVRPDRQTASAR